MNETKRYPVPRGSSFQIHFKVFLKSQIPVRNQWLMPIILATLEANIRGIKVPSQPQAFFFFKSLS
jgi:hypothetical protein